METDDQNRPWQAGDSASDMIRVLEEMIELNEDITTRAVARRHPTLAHASTITRNPDRAALLAKYQAKQKELRNWQGLFKDQSYAKLTEELARKDQRIAELEREVEILKESHLAMIRAVGEVGGIESYRHVREDLERMGVISYAAEVEDLGTVKTRERSHK